VTFGGDGREAGNADDFRAKPNPERPCIILRAEQTEFSQFVSLGLVPRMILQHSMVRRRRPVAVASIGVEAPITSALMRIARTFSDSIVFVIGYKPGTIKAVPPEIALVAFAAGLETE